jgi:hypothetical protein
LLTGPLPPLHLQLVDDSLAVLNLPEWPAAELLLRKLASQLLPIVRGTSSAVNAKTRQIGLDLLGKLAATVRGEITTLAQQVEEYVAAGDEDVSETEDVTPAAWQRSRATIEIDRMLKQHIVTLNSAEEDNQPSPEESLTAISELQDAMLRCVPRPSLRFTRPVFPCSRMLGHSRNSSCRRSLQLRELSCRRRPIL